MATTAWGDYFGNLAQDSFKTVLDYQIADVARDNNFSAPVGNLFTNVPERVPQPITNNVTPTGQPLQVFYKADGSLNLAYIGAAAIGLLLVLR